MVSRKKFRKDLFYRINGAVIKTPSLRDRIEDLPRLVEHFVLAQEGPRFSVDKDTMKYLCSLTWPGNVRELKNSVSTAITMAKARKSSVLEIRDFVRFKHKVIKAATKQASDVATSERDRILAVLERVHGNMSVASKKLEMGRATLYRKIKAYGIPVKPIREVQ
jgi:DNA-binding NtrC family response regulator